ncbi:MAG: hypothetical protein AAB074_22290 [Planctomycetota bacterium]
MKWTLIFAMATAAAFAIAGCSEPGTDDEGTTPIPVDSGANDAPCTEPYEFAFFQFARKGDFRPTGDRKPRTMYTLLYTAGWMKSRTFGGPFEAQVKREGIEVFWKEIKKRATHDLYAYMYEKGFFDLPGSDLVDWTRFKEPGYTTKAIAVTRDDVRHIVFFEDITGERGDDPRWGTFNDCVNQMLSTYSSIEDVRAHVQKGGFDSALEAYLKGR